jgi:spore maturation protein CgeB
MKFIFSAYHNPHYRTITEYMEAAIRLEGHECASFDNRAFMLPGRTRSALPTLARLDGWWLNKRLYGFTKKHRPDVFIEEGGTRIAAATVAAIGRLGTRTVLWTTDAPTDFGPIAESAGAYHTVLCSGSEAIDLLDRKGAKCAGLLPYACDPDEHKATELDESEKRRWGADVAFVGSYYPNRRSMLSSLGSLDLGIWGSGWHNLSPEDPLRSRVRGLHMRTEEWVKVYSASRIAVAVHYQDGSTPCHQVSPKVFEAMACGIMVLVDDQKDVFRLFEDGRHLVRFRNAEELKAKASYYLSHPEERRRIASAGREEVLAKHTYRHRVRQLVGLLAP